MRFLIEMKRADSGRALTAQAGAAFLEQLVLPTLEGCLRPGQATP